MSCILKVKRKEKTIENVVCFSIINAALLNLAPHKLSITIILSDCDINMLTIQYKIGTLSLKV